MNINHFKTGDIITRNEGMTYAHNDSVDGSYTGDRLILRGHDVESKIIFFSSAGKYDDKKEIRELSYARDGWDAGWAAYPETMYQKIKKSITNLKK